MGQQATWVVGTAGGVALLFGLSKLWGDLKTGIALRNRPRQPWEI